MKVYALPKEVPAPKVDFKNFDIQKELAAQEEHRKDLENWLRGIGYTGKNTGKILAVPFADGQAQYMFAEGPKSFLVHLPYGDAWDSPDVKFLPKKEVLRRIEMREKRNALFAAK